MSTTITLPDVHATQITPHTARRYVVICCHQHPRLETLRSCTVWRYTDDRQHAIHSAASWAWRPNVTLYVADLETGELVG